MSFPNLDHLPVGPLDLPIYAEDFPLVNTLGIRGQRHFTQTVGDAEWVVRPVCAKEITCEAAPGTTARLSLDQIIEVAQAEFAELAALGIPTVPTHYGLIERARYPAVPGIHRSYEAALVGDYQLAALVEVIRPVPIADTVLHNQQYLDAVDARTEALELYHSQTSPTGYRLWDLRKSEQFVPVPAETGEGYVCMLVDIEPRIYPVAQLEEQEGRL